MLKEVKSTCCNLVRAISVIFRVSNFFFSFFQYRRRISHKIGKLPCCSSCCDTRDKTLNDNDKHLKDPTGQFSPNGDANKVGIPATNGPIPNHLPKQVHTPSPAPSTNNVIVYTNDTRGFSSPLTVSDVGPGGGGRLYVKQDHKVSNVILHQQRNSPLLHQIPPTRQNSSLLPSQRVSPQQMALRESPSRPQQRSPSHEASPASSASAHHFKRPSSSTGQILVEALRDKGGMRNLEWLVLTFFDAFANTG